MERIADAITTVSIILSLTLGGVALYEHDGTLGLLAVGFFVVGYGALRVAEGERKEKEQNSGR